MNVVYRQLNLICVVSSCMILFLTGCTDDQHSSQNTASPPTIITGDLEVYYEIETSEGGSYGTGSSPAEVSEIHFFDQYIVIKADGQNGRVLPITRIKIFRWHQSQ